MDMDESRIEKRFIGFTESRYEEQLAELLERIPIEHFAVGLLIAEHVREHIQKPLNENLVLMISDHISFAIEHWKKGQLLLKFDIDYIKSQGYTVVTPIIVTNSDDFADIVPEASGKVTTDSKLLTLIK